jgi:hypothetical protein
MYVTCERLDRKDLDEDSPGDLEMGTGERYDDTGAAGYISYFFVL